MEHLKFRNSDILPQIGLGTWLSKPSEVYDAVVEAIKTGYRQIDCAYIYKNEKEIGQALKFVFSEGIVKREELFITSKLWNSFHSPEQVEPAIRKSLEDLQLEYLDLYLIHWPLAFKKEQAQHVDDLISLDKIPLLSTWKAMEHVKEKRLSRHIGVSNFNIPKITDLIANSTISPEVLQVEIHPYLQQNELINFCKVNNILVTAYSPLGSRHLIQSGDTITKNPVIVEIARRHNCPAAQIILAWGMQRGTIVIPKSVNASRIKENFGSLNVTLDNEDMQRISTIDRNLRNAKGLFAVMPGGPYTYESIWEK
ncbi:MAG: aldo/keto reductase [Paludibacteraceae bacterium]